MKILRIEIAAFGKWRQKSFDFYSGNQLIYGETKQENQRFINLSKPSYLDSLQKAVKKRIIHQKTAQPMAAKYGLYILYTVSLLSSAVNSKIVENRRYGWGTKLEVMNY